VNPFLFRLATPDSAIVTFRPRLFVSTALLNLAGWEISSPCGESAQKADCHARIVQKLVPHRNDSAD
jgi:hypothetical protein